VDAGEVVLVPELEVSDLNRAVSFYERLGFHVAYERPEEGFVCLHGHRATLMLQGAGGPGRTFRTASLQWPFGRGVNFQIEVDDVGGLFETARETDAATVLPMEDRWYRAGAEELGNRQFVLADPDGYLLRFFEDLGSRASAS
jgi:catechol 2,3-dioxygenase-like lactoylglutathione lyase family enzyme